MSDTGNPKNYELLDKKRNIIQKLHDEYLNAANMNFEYINEEAFISIDGIDNIKNYTENNIDKYLKIVDKIKRQNLNTIYEILAISNISEVMNDLKDELDLYSESNLYEIFNVKFINKVNTFDALKIMNKHSYTY